MKCLYFERFQSACNETVLKFRMDSFLNRSPLNTGRVEFLLPCFIKWSTSVLSLS